MHSYTLNVCNKIIALMVLENSIKLFCVDCSSVVGICKLKFRGKSNDILGDM